MGCQADHTAATPGVNQLPATDREVPTRKLVLPRSCSAHRTPPKITAKERCEDLPPGLGEIRKEPSEVGVPVSVLTGGIRV